MITDDVWRELKIDELWSTLELAEIRALDVSELLERLETIWEDPHSNAVIYRLREIDLTPSEKSRLVQIIRHLATVGDKLPCRKKQRVDYKLKQLLLTLADPTATEIAASFLDHPRKVRRGIGYYVLQKVGVNASLGRELLARFEETRDEDLLEIVARNPQAVVGLDYTYLLENLGNKYWRMRVFEALLSSKYDAAVSLASQYPFEFTHATGRLGYHRNLPIVQQLLAENKEDVEFVSIYTWALGKLGAREQLQEARELIQEHFKKRIS